MSASEPRGSASAGRIQRVPSALVGFIVASAVAIGVFLAGKRSAYEGGCDGGLCGLGMIIALGASIASWLVVFILATLATWGLKRLDVARAAARRD